MTAASTAPRNRGGRPRVGDQVKIAFPADMLTAIDTAAARGGITRSEWVRQACAALLPW